MQLKYKSGEVKHVQNDIGQAIIAAGLAVEIPSTVKKPAPDSSWVIQPGALEEHPPFIRASCSTCGNPSFCGGPTAHKTMRYLHCGIVEMVPPHVAKQYAKDYDDWRSGKEQRPSSVSPAQRDIERKRFEQLQKSRHLQQGKG